MKQQSVKKIAEQLEPVKKYVEACWNSPKRYHIFCLVEGEFDKHIYEARLNNRDIEVKIAADDNLNHNRSSVQYLVEDLRKLHPQGRFIGIRDKDYMTLMGQSCPDGIYVTDSRDLEMMILASQSFQASDANITTYSAKVFTCCIPMAQIRIFAEKKHLRKKLNDKMNIAIVYNQQTKQYVNNVWSCLTTKYLNLVDADSCLHDIEAFIASANLTQYSAFDVCRGHDVIGLMEFVYGNDYSKETMECKMEKYYSKEDFYNTFLFASISQYCNSFGIEAKV